MTEKELGRLNRRQLLEMLLEQTKRANDLESELEKKEKQLAEKEALLSDRRVILEKAGNIAEASLAISKIFESAQSAADIYLKNIEAHSKRGDELLADAKKRSDEMLAEAKKRSDEMLVDAKKRCAVLEKQTADKIRAFKDEVGRLNFSRDSQPSE
ncbi:MAG: hypothetical protein J1E34_01370 [Oscillospiraceae bacterium]|nr:hypothetical protein [Oscillospiraceae bacterium]